MSTKLRLVRCPKCWNVLPEPAEVPVYKCGFCGTVLQAKKRNNDTVDTLGGKRKMEQVCDDQDSGSTSNLVNNSIDESDRKSDHNQDEDQDAAKKAEHGTHDAPVGRVEEYSSGERKKEQLSDDQESGTSLNKKLLVNSNDDSDQNSDHNDPRSSTELSGHEDPESSPEDTSHNRIEQEQDHHQDAAKKQKGVAVEHSSGKQKMEQHSDDEEAGSSLNQQSLVTSITEPDEDQDHHQEEGMFMINGTLENCENGDGYEESSRELTASPEKCSFSEPSRAAIANKKIVRDSDGGSKSSFKSLIAEKLLILSEDGSADLRHRRRFDRISSAETLENGQFGGTNYYEYEGSESSFDGNGRRNHYKHRHEFHPSNGRWGKHEHRSTDVGSFYGIPENAKMERLELMKMVRELQDQLERTNVSNPAQQVPSYYNHISNHQERYGRRMAFSGKAVAVNRRRDVDSCHHCCSPDRHFSAQLPRQHGFSNGPHYIPSTSYNSHYSGPSNPHRRSESEFSAPVWSRPGFDDHRHRNDVLKPKRYVRPIAGGSPWITCYRCSELLQLPESFLVFKRRYHSLTCGSCLKVLNFMVSNGTHLHRYYPEENMAAPPSSEVEEYGNSTRSRADPVSCSDRSFQKSCSTETDRNGSLEFNEERRQTTRPSSKVSGRRKKTSVNEEIEPASSGSPLHWLMGYASPSKVIRG